VFYVNDWDAGQREKYSKIRHRDRSSCLVDVQGFASLTAHPPWYYQQKMFFEVGTNDRANAAKVLKSECVMCHVLS
jgi:hypothetical protein